MAGEELKSKKGAATNISNPGGINYSLKMSKMKLVEFSLKKYTPITI